MKFTAIAIATACLLNLSTMVVAQDDYVVADRNKPQNPQLVDFGLSGFIMKKRDTNSKLYKRGQNSGKGTFFSPNRGSCGWKNSKDDLIVAVNEKDMGNKKKGGRNVNCGRLIEISNNDGKKVKVKVVDTVSIQFFFLLLASFYSAIF